MQGALLQNLGMDGSYTVYIAGTVHSQICHVNHIMLDNLDILNEVRIALLLIQLINKAVVDLLNDLINIRNDLDEQMLVPLLQCLRQNGVVGVSKGLLCNIECIVEANAFVSGQLTNELRNRDNRMGIVELDGIEISEMREVIAMYQLIVFNHILQRCTAEEILLLQAQLLALIGGVVRIQHAGNILCAVLLANRCFIVLIVEFVEVEGGQRLCLPQTQVSDVLGAITDNRQVIRHCTHGLVCKANENCIGIYADAPRIAEARPVIGGLLLEAVLNVLLKQTIFIANAIAVEREIQRCCGIQEACSQTSQAAVAQGSILYFFHVGQLETALVKQLFYFIVNTKAKQIVIDCTANQKFCGHIICMACFSVQLLAFLPRSGDLCHNCFGKSMMNILCIGLVEILAAVTLQVYFHLFHQFGTIHSVYHLSLYSRQRGFCLRGFGSGSAALLHLTYAIHPSYAPYVDMIIAYHFDVFNKKIIKPCNFLVHMYCL